MAKNKHNIMKNNNSLIPIQPKSIPTTICKNKGKSGTGGNGPKKTNMSHDKFFHWYDKMCKMYYKELFETEFLDIERNWKTILIEQQPKERHLSVCQVCDMVLQISPRTISEHCCGKRHRQNLTIKVFDLRKIISSTNNNSGSVTAATSNLEKIIQIKNIVKHGGSDQIHKIIDSTEDNTQKVNELIQKLLFSMPNMLLNDLEKIEFKFIDTAWKKMFIRIDNRYDCMLCNSNRFSNLVEMRNHLLKPEHKKNLKLVTGLHHPNVSPIKDLNYHESKIILQEIEKNDAKNIDKHFFDNRSSTEYINPFAKPKVQDIINLTEIVTHAVETNHKSIPQNMSNRNSPKRNEIVDIDNCGENLLPSQEITSATNLPRNKKLSDQEFREIIHNLEVGQVSEIEFYKNNSWRKMIMWVSKQFACKLCSVQQISTFKNLQEHFRGKNHKNKMITVEKFYHPKLTLEQKSINEVTENSRQIDSNAGTIKITINSTSNTSPDNMETKTVTENEKLTTETIIDDDVIITYEHPETITLEDSPERELPQIRTKNMVLNPLAIVSNISQNDRNTPREMINENINHSNISTFGNRPTTADVIVVNESIQHVPSFSTKNFFDTTENDVEGFIGVEYVVRILKHGSQPSSFECCLCERELDGPGMQDHLKGSTHRIKYLERHFPTCWKYYRQYRNDNAVITPITEKISVAIEKYHGRDLPFECKEFEFRSNRQDIMSKVYSFRHASELSGPSFTNIIDKKTLDCILQNKDISRPENNFRENRTSFINYGEKQKTYPFVSESNVERNLQQLHIPPQIVNISNTIIPIIESHRRNLSNLNCQNRMIPQHQLNENLYQLPFINGPQTPLPTLFSPPGNFIPQLVDQNYSQPILQLFTPNNPTLDDEEHKRLAERFIQNTMIQERRSTRSPLRRHSKPQRDSTPSRQRSRSSIRRRRSPSKSPLRDDDVWQAYRRKFDYDVKILNLDFQSYTIDPQSYPMYDEEWQTFWAKRSIELRNEGIDEQHYDFTTEWSTYFLDRLDHIYENDIENLKYRLRQRFVLPMHNKELCDKKYEKYRLNRHYPGEDGEQLEAPQPPCITAPSKSPSPFSLNKSQESISPDREKNILISEDENNSLCSKKRKKNASKDDDLLEEKVTTLSVLRLLTVLEDNLGSLGPKVIDLLSKALTLKKTKLIASAELLIMDNCGFLELCREKLKSQLVADCIPMLKMRTARQAIKEITILVKEANEKRVKNAEMEKRKIPQAKNQTQSQKRPSQNQTPARQNQQKNIASTTTQQENISQPISMSQAKKKEMAQKLTTLLMGMGKTDISSELCEELVEVYQAIDQKKIEHLDSQENCLSNKLLKIIGDLQKQQEQSNDQVNLQQQQLVPETQTVQSYQQDSTIAHNNFPTLSNFDTSLNLPPLSANRSSLIRSDAQNDESCNNVEFSFAQSLANQHFTNAMQALRTIHSQQQMTGFDQGRNDSNYNQHSNTNISLYEANNQNIPNNNNNLGTNPGIPTNNFNYQMFLQQQQLGSQNSSIFNNNNTNFDYYYNRNNDVSVASGIGNDVINNNYGYDNSNRRNNNYNRRGVNGNNNNGNGNNSRYNNNNNVPNWPFNYM